MSALAVPSRVDQPLIVNATTHVVRAAGLGRIIDDRPIIRGIDLAVAPGSFLGLIGANGAGKSSLLSVLATLTLASEGTLELFGQTVTRNSAALRARIGMIGHRPMLYRDLTARENLLLFGRLYGVASPAERAMRMLEQVGLTDRADDCVNAFSRGMTQRLAIARALMHDPQLLLADEPFSGLDIASTDKLDRLLRQLHEQGRTIVLAHHELNHAFDMAQRLAVLRHGRLVLEGGVDELTRQQVREEVVR